MRVFIPDRTGIYLPHSTQTRGNVTWLGFSGIIFVCAGLICLNFRARLLSRTTWKEKRQEQKQQRHQQQSTEQLNQKRFVQWEGQSKRTVSRPLPNPNGVFSDCYLTDGKHTREDPTQDLGGVQQPTLLHDCSNDDPSPKNMITVGCGCSLESQYVTPHGFRHGSIPSDGPVTASPVTSDSSRTRRIFHIPHWVSFHLIFCCILRSTGD
ncbi:hypothetical protein FBUS_01674 [Fasciolopsis buskii]|uniref:Uncharacterized protein n=1 Tax=Fasciolopsis buskii TaxID=27845 RepID=A0A8E0VNV5_9TREM|nr:hypothetical protein FBUS_01674 [Fasciolopsis buski]